MTIRSHYILIDVSMQIVPGSVFHLGTPPVEIASHRFYHEESTRP